MTAGINLLPGCKELRFEKERNLKRQMLLVFIVVVAVLVLWHLVLWRQINAVKKQINSIQQQLSLFEQRLPDKNNMQKEQVVNKIINLEQERVGLINFFEKLHLGMTANTQLTQLIIKNNEIKLFGKADSMFGITELLKIFSKNKSVVQKVNRQAEKYNFVLLCFY